MIRIKSIAIFFLGAVISFILYFKHGSDTSLTQDGLLSMIAFITITIPLTVAGLILIIFDIDKMMMSKTRKKNFLSIGYNYFKIGIGILVVFLGLFMIYKITVESSDVNDSVGLIWLVIIVGILFRLGSVFIIGGYKELRRILQRI